MKKNPMEQKVSKRAEISKLLLTKEKNVCDLVLTL